MLGSCSSAHGTTRRGVSASYSATPSTLGLLSTQGHSPNRICSYSLKPASGDDYAGVACVWCRSLLFRRRPSFFNLYLTFLYPTISSPPGFILTVVSPWGSPQLVRPYFLSVVEGAIGALFFFHPGI